MLDLSKICVIIPCYNNVKTIVTVTKNVLEIHPTVIVMCDGCTDGSLEAIQNENLPITVLSYEKNRGKGYALQYAFNYARKQGFTYAITLDADGQHYATDIPKFIKAIEKNYGAMFVGKRILQQKNKAKSSVFANKFSNFWFTVQTWRNLPDTQSGFRAYPIYRLKNLRLVTSRYEAELEFLVRMAWRNFKLIDIPIQVYYAPKEERVSHFNPAKDFTRISILNTFLCVFAIIYGYPSMLLRRLFKL